MLMTGTLMNTAAIVFGGLGGLLFGKRLRDRHQETLTMACGVGTLFIGISAAMNYMLHNDLFPDGGAMLVIICLALGGLIGELLNIESLFERFGAWLKRHPGGADAALCENDHAGALVVGELARLGLTTPRDVLVAGCDADLPVPGMWSVSPDTGAIAAHAISLLRAMIEDGASGERVVHVPDILDENGNPISTPFRTAS